MLFRSATKSRRSFCVRLLFTSELGLVDSSVNGSNVSTWPCPSLSSVLPLSLLDLVLLRLPRACHPSSPKLPLRISFTLGALDVAAAVPAKKPNGGSWFITRSSVKLVMLCVTLVARLRLGVDCSFSGCVGDDGADMAASLRCVCYCLLPMDALRDVPLLMLEMADCNYQRS